MKNGRDELASFLQGTFEVLDSKGIVVPSVVWKVPESLTEVMVSGFVRPSNESWAPQRKNRRRSNCENTSLRTEASKAGFVQGDNPRT